MGWTCEGQHSEKKVFSKVSYVQERISHTEIGIVAKGEDAYVRELQLGRKPERPEVFNVSVERPGFLRRPSQAVDEEEICIWIRRIEVKSKTQRVHSTSWIVATMRKLCL